MVKTVLSVSHQGLRDWVIQRVSAVLMAVYSIGFIAYLLSHPGLSFAEWQQMFSHTSVRVATILFLAALLFHAWVGMWTIFTDYVKPFVLRCLLHSLVLLMLIACFVWGVMILWSL